jgi:hypothetical protein
MADEQREERSLSSDERPDQEKAAKPEPEPKPLDTAQEIEAEDRFEATDN